MIIKLLQNYLKILVIQLYGKWMEYMIQEQTIYNCLRHYVFFIKFNNYK